MGAVERLLQGLWASSDFHALVIVVAAFVIAKLADWLLTGLLAQIARRTRSALDDELIALLHRPIFISVVLGGLYLAIPYLELRDSFQALLFGIVETVAVLIWTLAAMQVAGRLLQGLSRMANRVRWLDERSLPLISNVVKVCVLALALYFLFLSWHINLTAWLASAGIIGIALGFAAQESLANLFGGFSIMMDAPYKIGDFIVLDGGERGQVTKIGLRSTRVLTRDDVEVTIPNSQIANAKIVNESGGPWTKQRVRAAVGVAYGSDIDRVSEVLLEAAQSVEYVSESPKPIVRFVEFGDSSLVFNVLVWIDDPLYQGRTLDAMNRAIYKALGREQITIPFPQRDLYLKEWPSERRPDIEN